MLDELEVVLGKYLKIVQDDLDYANKTPDYYNKATLILFCRMRDGLKLAYDTAAELNALPA